MLKQPASVLFACTYNSVRSPMAEGITKHLVGTRIYVDSVGVRSQIPNGYAIAVMDEIGIDIKNHKAKTFDTLADSSFDLIITMSPEAQHRAVELTRTLSVDLEYWPTYDPTAARGGRAEMLTSFRQIRDDLFEKIRRRFAEFEPPNH